MPDSYIDYLEVGEYGGGFVKASEPLVGASALVDVAALRTKVADAVAKVDGELEKVGIRRGDLRTGRSGAGEAAEVGRKEIERFWHHLHTLDDGASADIEAFFPGNKLGALAALKPADVRSRLGEVLRGFAAPGNASLPDRPKWEQKLTAAHDALDAALGGKGTARAGAIQGTAGLIAAREEFLRVYNRVAKPVVRGLLAELGREGELRLFFPDLTANERSRKPSDAASEEAPVEAG